MRGLLLSETALRYDAVRRDDDRRCIMAIAVQQISPIAHLPLVLGVLRRLEVAPVIDRLITPHPEHVLSTGRGVEALVLAILDGHHGLAAAAKPKPTVRVLRREHTRRSQLS